MDRRRRRRRFTLIISGAIILGICTIGMICMTLQEAIRSLDLFYP